MNDRRLYMAVNGKVFTDQELRDAEDAKPATDDDLDFLYAVLRGYSVKVWANQRLRNRIEDLIVELDEMED